MAYSVSGATGEGGTSSYPSVQAAMAAESANMPYTKMASSPLVIGLLGKNATPDEVKAFMSNIMSWFTTVINENIKRAKQANAFSRQVIEGQY